MGRGRMGRGILAGGGQRKGVWRCRQGYIDKTLCWGMASNSECGARAGPVLAAVPYIGSASPTIPVTSGSCVTSQADNRAALLGTEH